MRRFAVLPLPERSFVVTVMLAFRRFLRRSARLSTLTARFLVPRTNRPLLLLTGHQPLPASPPTLPPSASRRRLYHARLRGAITTRMTNIEQLFPERRSMPLEDAYADLGMARLAEGRNRPYVVANMVATVDGRASFSGRTKEISSPADRQLFRALRGQVDAVMAGTATIGIERYGPLVRDEARRAGRDRRGLAPVPLAVTASRSLQLPVEAPLFADPDSRIVVLAGAAGEAPDAPAEVIVERVPGPDGRTLDFLAGLERLRDRHGVRTLLLEGGPTLLGAMLEAGVVDELFLARAPLLVSGPEPSIVEGPPLPGPPRLRLVSLFEDESYLFARYAVGAPG
jgi:riboflavin biosynthesis pyrimidine reductase